MQFFAMSLSLVGLGITFLVIRTVYLNSKSPVRDIPGPFLAKYTDFWRLWDYYKGTQGQEERTISLLPSTLLTETRGSSIDSEIVCNGMGALRTAKTVPVRG
ncbi:hypothetical protein BKA67DRAFT_537263 [Truncatella angustata]|uniref:Uncharacterized protein n=1 Tax=Truncatella angustata TaxID=152316 RepID=A0A9P8UK42_9PEZI|nr:uncharacterized protein BKA67DRAFT_537263 [Truncatella angustata]KAH6653634.1 hypothetical protein BKA67DRAFT_537263 [Truncatella angustata]